MHMHVDMCMYMDMHMDMHMHIQMDMHMDMDMRFGQVTDLIALAPFLTLMLEVTSWRDLLMG